MLIKRGWPGVYLISCQRLKNWKMEEKKPSLFNWLAYALVDISPVAVSILVDCLPLSFCFLYRCITSASLVAYWDLDDGFLLVGNLVGSELVSRRPGEDTFQLEQSKLTWSKQNKYKKCWQSRDIAVLPTGSGTGKTKFLSGYRWRNLWRHAFQSPYHLGCSPPFQREGALRLNLLILNSLRRLCIWFTSSTAKAYGKSI